MLREYRQQYQLSKATQVSKMTVRKILGMASILALMAAPVLVVADETGGAMAGGAEGWMAVESAIGGVKNGALATLAVGAGVGLAFGIAEIADDDDSSSSSTTTTTTTGP